MKARKLVTLVLALALVIPYGMQGITAASCTHENGDVLFDENGKEITYVDEQKHRITNYELWGCPDCSYRYRRHVTGHDQAHTYDLVEILEYYTDNSDCYRYRCVCGHGYDKYVPHQ